MVSLRHTEFGVKALGLKVSDSGGILPSKTAPSLYGEDPSFQRESFKLRGRSSKVEVHPELTGQSS